MYPLSLLTATLLGKFVLSMTPPAPPFQSLGQQNTATLTEPLVPDYTPTSFIQTYNQTYCPSNTTAVFVPPVFAHYPLSPFEVYRVVGSFVNITWISSAFNDTTFVGTDNIPGVVRTEPRDPFGAVEILFNYATEVSSYGFYHQQAAHVGKDIKVAPGLLETDSHAVLQMMPACNDTGTSWGFYLTYCFDNATMQQTPGFNVNVAVPVLTQAIVNGTTSSLKNLWKILDGDRNTPFNSTNSCESIEAYQQGVSSTE